MGNAIQCAEMQSYARGPRNPRWPYTMGGQRLEVTEEERDIGVQVPVSRTIKPAAQCAKAARTATTVLGQITRSFTYRDKKVYIALYK
jgi:hypothetical protein